MTEMEPPAPTAPEAPAPPPAWQPPPAPPAWQPPVPPPPARPPRPAMVTVASIILIVLGTLVSLLGLFVVLGGALIGSMGDSPSLGIDLEGLPDAIGGFVAVLGAVVLGFGVVELLSGIFSLLGRAWARILAIVMSVLGGLFALIGILGSRSGDAASPIVNVVLLAAYVFVVWAMARAGRYFAEG